MPSEMKEGWGLTHDDKYLYATDSTKNYHKINPETFEVVETIQAKDYSQKPIDYLNENEMVDNSFMFANRFLTDNIYMLNKLNGMVMKVWDLSELKSLQKYYM